VSLDSYGGNPDIVATRQEIERVAFEIRLCAEELTAWPALEMLLTDPLHQLQFRVASIGIYQKLQRLHNHCLIASENYFTTEAQIHRRFELTFVPEIARLVSNLAFQAGWNLDRQVSASLVSTGRSSKPDSITQLLDRLWRLSSKDEPTIGIDLFENTAGSKTAVVLIPGTQTFGFGDNPLDMTSNIQAMGSSGSAVSEKAVLLAIRQAGIESKDEVILVGHSQGGMVAGNIAAHPIGFIAAGLITFGAPVAQLRNLKAPVMAIEHTNDPVPNLSGKANPLKKNWVTVQRVSSKAESNAVLFSHSLKSYKNTAVAIDASADTGIRNIRSELLQKLAGAKPSKSLEFRISRESR
jgi:pimeloyl-ACP methyl ester carboxylesterase